VVRVPWNDMVTIKRVLDIGAQSLLVPYVSTRAEAESAVSYTRYPPSGVRGLAGTTRAALFGRIKDYARRAHEEICLLLQVETQAALDNIETICAVEGVDGVFIGPADLHASLGYPGEIANPKVKPLIDEAIRRIRKAGKAPGILTPNEADARHWLECGALFVAVGADVGILARGAEALAAKFRLRDPKSSSPRAAMRAPWRRCKTSSRAISCSRARSATRFSSSMLRQCAAWPHSVRCRWTAS
jgi:4-hydroxy-2-oxoheptanedioate aldolase